jgi:hypothetical protein
MKLIRDYCYKIEAFTKKDLNLLVINHYLWMGSVHHPSTRESYIYLHDISSLPNTYKVFYHNFFILISQIYYAIL